MKVDKREIVKEIMSEIGFAFQEEIDEVLFFHKDNKEQIVFYIEEPISNLLKSVISEIETEAFFRGRNSIISNFKQIFQI